MSKANDLIERLEQECGCRYDDNGGNNLAMAGLFGAMSRMLGQHAFDPRDDVAVGMLIRHRMTPEYAAQQQSKSMLADLLAQGVSPDDLTSISKALK
jgi:hypothetical protein